MVRNDVCSTPLLRDLYKMLKERQRRWEIKTMCISWRWCRAVCIKTKGISSGVDVYGTGELRMIKPNQNGVWICTPTGGDGGQICSSGDLDTQVQPTHPTALRAAWILRYSVFCGMTDSGVECMDFTISTRRFNVFRRQSWRSSARLIRKEDICALEPYLWGSGFVEM